MKFTKFLILMLFAFGSFALKAQSLFPALKDNQSAKEIVEAELENVAIAYKSNPSPLNERRIELYASILDFLNEPMKIKPSTEYALTSAYLNTSVKWDRISDSEAFQQFHARQWTPDFTAIVNKLKL